MLVGLGLGGHFGKALEDSGKENFTKDEICIFDCEVL